MILTLREYVTTTTNKRTYLY